MQLLKYLRWLLNGKPVIEYEGCNCGCCRVWINESFVVPAYKSGGEWWDTWGICNSCLKGA